MVPSRKVASPKARRFSSEAALVECFVEKLERGRTRYGRVEVVTEWDHRSGLVDVLARDSKGTLVAFEAKLENWRRAFDQAYRNTAYADRVYVLLPPTAAQRAMQNREQFELRGIGLCSFDGRASRVLIEASDHDALLKWVRARAHEHFDTIADERAASSRPAAGRGRAVQGARA
jgi:predicted nuclease with RNAse H fold